MAMTLSADARERLTASIKRYFDENMDEEIGELKASLLLEFFVKEIGPTIYNQAIAEAQAYMQEKAVDLDGVLYEPEFAYWKE